jgi:hypothetical protein
LKIDWKKIDWNKLGTLHHHSRPFMLSPFLGMYPYLEQPMFWSEFHSRLIVAIADALAPILLPRYYIGVETRTYMDHDEGELLIGIPDAVILSAKEPLQNSTPIVGAAVATQTRPQEVTLPMPSERKERYLEVCEAGTDGVVTVIEILSPKNKRKGPGRTAYEEKRHKILSSYSHLVELDLLRSGTPMAMQGADSGFDYRILVSRSERRPTAELYGFMVQEVIPRFSLPLKATSESVMVNLQEIVQGVYERGGYGIRIDYQQVLAGLAEGDLS